MEGSMVDDTDQTPENVADARESGRVRREIQDRQDPSGHGMQVTPRQQQHIAETSDDPTRPTAAEIDDDALEDLKGDNRS
jgi:hypothetical protein